MGRKSVKKSRSQNSKKRHKYLLKLMPIFYEYGLQELSMDIISDKLKITKPTLYNYFATKEEMVAGILEHVLGEISQFEQIMADKERSFLERYFTSVQLLTRSVAGISNKFLTDIQENFPVLWEQVRQFRDYAASVLERFYEEGKELGILSGYSTNILVLSDRIFFDALTEPRILSSNNLTIQQAFYEYFKLKSFGMISGDVDPEIQSEAKRLLKELKI